MVTDSIVDRATKDAVRAWLEEGATKTTPPDPDAVESAIVTGARQLITPGVPHYSQGDERWASRILGRGSSIRREGCAISCIAMVLSFYGRNVTPETLDTYLDEHDGYAGNSVKWSVAGQCGFSGSTPQLRYDRTTGSTEELMSTLSERIEKNLPTLVRVDYETDPGLKYNHFVVCVGKTTDGDFIMNDPATSAGNGYKYVSDDNIIQKTSRKSGYNIVQLDQYDRV